MNLKRTDLVRVVVERMREEIAREVVDAGAAEVVAREGFRRAMLAEAGARWNGVLEDACRMVGTDSGRLVVDVHLEMTDDVLASPPDVVSVTIRDDEPYSARMVLRLRLPVAEDALRGWVAAVRRRMAAEARGVRAKDLDAEARARMVDEVLGGSEDGRRILELLRVVNGNLDTTG